MLQEDMIVWCAQSVAQSESESIDITPCGNQA